MKILLRVVLIGLLAGVLLSACAGQGNSLYGTWRSTDKTQTGLTLEFRQDGQLLMTSQGMTQEAVYELTGDNKDTLLLKASKDTPAAQGNPLAFSISGDTLTLKISGSDQTFTRLK